MNGENYFSLTKLLHRFFHSRSEKKISSSSKTFYFPFFCLRAADIYFRSFHPNSTIFFGALAGFSVASSRNEAVEGG